MKKKLILAFILVLMLAAVGSTYDYGRYRHVWVCRRVMCYKEYIHIGSTRRPERIPDPFIFDGHSCNRRRGHDWVLDETIDTWK